MQRRSSAWGRFRSRALAASTWLQKRIAPRTQYSQVHYEERLRGAVSPGICWLDLGCGHHVLPEWRAEEESGLVGRAALAVGIDPDLPSLVRHRSLPFRVQAVAGQLPIADDAFDLVTANMVVEHLDLPEVQFAEVHRILRKGGRFMFHTPNALAHTTRIARLIPARLKTRLALILEGRTAEDVFPTYYRANTVERIHELARRTGFAVEWIRPTTSLAAFSVLPPLALFELLWIRLLETPRFSRWRQTLIVSLRRG